MISQREIEDYDKLYTRLLERAERMRLYCLQFANLHPNDKSRCGDAIGRTHHAPVIAVHLADLVDDLVLALEVCQKQHIRASEPQTEERK